GNLHFKQHPRGAVHGRLFELLRQHLAEALETRDVDLGLAVELLAQELVLMRVVAGVEGLGALAQTIERWNRKIEVTSFDESAHLTEEKCDQQRSDVCAVDVSAGHYDQRRVAQLLRAISRAGDTAERLAQVAQELVVGELGRACRVHVEDLTPEW